MKQRSLIIFLSVTSVLVFGFAFIKVLSAYTNDPTAIQINLSGVELATELTEIEPSPFQLDQAKDSRRKPVSLGYVETEETEIKSEVSVYGGSSTIYGSIKGPDGQPHRSGAVVRIERDTKDGKGSITVRTNTDGKYIAKGLLGGRYTVRAWQPNQMTVPEPQTFFLDNKTDEELESEFEQTGLTNPTEYELNFQLIEYKDQNAIIEFVDGGPIYMGSNGLVAVSVTAKRVNSEGIVVTSPISGVKIKLEPQTGLASKVPEQKTDSTGLKTFVLECSTLGSKSVRVSIEYPSIVFTTNADGVKIGKTTIKKSSQLFKAPDCIPAPIPEPEPEIETVTDEIKQEGPNE